MKPGIWIRTEESPYMWVSDIGTFFRDPVPTPYGRSPAKLITRFHMSPKGYCRIRLMNNTYFAHRIVAKYHVPGESAFRPQVNHKDGNKSNNDSNNLEWVSNYENRQHAVKNKLHRARDPVLLISEVELAQELILDGMTQSVVASLLGVKQQTLSKRLIRLSHKKETSL